MVIGADHNNWRNLVQSGVHPPLFAKGCSLGREAKLKRGGSSWKEQAGDISAMDRPRERSKKKGEEWAKESEREKRARAVRARNRFPSTR